MSRLATQLSRPKKTNNESYLFSTTEADRHDLESIHALALNALLQLAAIEPSLGSYQERLLGHHVKSLNRELLSPEMIHNLDDTIVEFLSILGPYLMHPATGKILEWLVRQFRIHEFNVDALVSLFLPYCESPHFAKMLSILHIDQHSKWSFLLPMKATAHVVTRTLLAKQMEDDQSIARFIVSLLPNAISRGTIYRSLVAFNAAILHDFITRKGDLDESTVGYLLPALLKPLNSDKALTRSVVLGTFALLAKLSRKCQLQTQAVGAIINSMATTAHLVSAQQYLAAFIAVAQSQALLPTISDNTVDIMLRLPGILAGLRDAVGWAGSEKLLVPLISGLSLRLHDAEVISLLEVMITAHDIPPTVARQIALLVLHTSVSSKLNDTPLRLLHILSLLQRRHPVAVEAAASEMANQDSQHKAYLTQLMEMSSTPTLPLKQHDNAISSSTADVAARIVAVTSILDSLENNQDAGEIQLKLLERVQDSSAEVVQTLYQRPSVIVTMLVTHAETYVDHLQHALCTPSAKPKRALIRLHLVFLVTHFLPQAPLSTVNAVFHRIFFPFLLFSKSRQHTVEQAWAAISQYKLSKHDAFCLLSGCTELIKSGQEELGDPVVRMAEFNAAVVQRIAENMTQSDDFPNHFRLLLGHFQGQSVHARIMAYLIATAVIRMLIGRDRIVNAYKMIESLESTYVDGTEGKDTFEHITDHVQLGKLIVAKPSSQATLAQLQLFSLVSLAAIPCPVDASLNWFQAALPSDHQDSLYVSLMKTLYRTTCNGSCSPALSTKILPVLFSSTSGDTLALLSSIWADPQTDVEPERLRATSLRHGIALLQASLGGDQRVDLQTVLPSLLVAIQSPEVICRNFAMEAIYLLRQLADIDFATVYKFDAIYGERGYELQYLDQPDIIKYLDALLENRDHLVHDPEYLILVNRLHLGVQTTDRKRDVEYKQRVICFLASHANAPTTPIVQFGIFKSTAALSDKAKVLLMLPTINAILLPSVHESAQNPSLEDLKRLLLSSFDASIAPDLNERQSTLWTVFTSILYQFLIPSAVASSCHALRRVLEASLFRSLHPERKLEICSIMVDIGYSHPNAQQYCKSFLSTAFNDTILLIQLLKNLQPYPSGPRGLKRAKTDDPQDTTVSRLILTVEAMQSAPLPGSLDLISALLETLNRVVDVIPPSQPDGNYLEQILMSNIEILAGKVKEVPNSKPSPIRLDVLVEIIRVSDNTQTFQQSLLLMAMLAQLAPDSILQNIMPIFTFMGSNVFHRDDAYSFNVVQKTIENIVPIMVSSLKKQHSGGTQLHKASKDFLSLFTDAANHIPRHRRSSFYTHLVHVLGSRDFLPPIIMLLAEKLANRAIRQGPDELQATLTLPISIIQHHPADIQIQAMIEIVHECQGLVTKLMNPSISVSTFTDEKNERSSAGLLHIKRIVQTLISLITHTLQTSTISANPVQGSSSLTGLVSELLSFTTAAAPDANVVDILHAAHIALNCAVNAMTATDFVQAVASMLLSIDEKVQTSALQLLDERLVQVSKEVRTQITSTILSLVVAITAILASPEDNSRTRAALDALKTIIHTLIPGEEMTLSRTVTALLSCVKQPYLVNSALTALSPLCVKLGPRIIPFFRDIVSSVVTVPRAPDESSRLAYPQAFDVLHSLLSSIPQFWSSAEFQSILHLHIEIIVAKPDDLHDMSRSLVKAVTRRAPANVLLPAVIDLWPNIGPISDPKRVNCYFDILGRTLRTAPRISVSDFLRPLLNTFLEGFDIASEMHHEFTGVILAFKDFVNKLNEATFRPIFRRLYDWAFASDAATILQKVIFLRAYISLLDFFKGLMVPYMSLLFGPILSILQGMKSLETADNELLWVSALEVTSHSLVVDDAVFWRDDRLSELSDTLIQQLPLCVGTNALTATKDPFQDCLLLLVENTTDDAPLKKINLDLLLHTRTETIQNKLCALKYSIALWTAHGRKLAGFAAETATFIAECNEDENDTIVRASLGLKAAVEAVAGRMDEL